MSLQSFYFLFFMAVVAVVFYLIPRRFQYIWLCLASLFFYLSGDIRYFAGLAFCTATTYVTGLLLGREADAGKGISPARESDAGKRVSPERETDTGKRMPSVRRQGAREKLLLSFCLGIHILVLLMLRYPLAKSVLAPLGISFYALQAMGYVIEVYRGNMKPERNPARYAVYVAFFPTVLSGPIQRAPKLLPQIREGKDFDYHTVHSGLYLLLWGYLLKLVLANPLGRMVDYAYGNCAELPGATLLWATVLYAVQLYLDFAGYSALAIGAAKILGFDIGRNFEQPYFAASVKDFWRRWHISLSFWLRDYVYIPLGGNRKGKVRKYVNLMATFLVSGLWHGTGLQYLVWGGIHGLCQVLESCIPMLTGAGTVRFLPGRGRAAGSHAPGGRENLTALENKRERRGGVLHRMIRGAVTFALVDFAWLFFRSDSMAQAFAILYRVFFCFQFKEMTYYGSYLMGRTKMELFLLLLGIGLVFLVDLLHEKKISIEDFAARKIPLAVRWAVYIALTLGILLVTVREYGQGASNFIYTRF